MKNSLITSVPNCLVTHWNWEGKSKCFVLFIFFLVFVVLYCLFNSLKIQNIVRDPSQLFRYIK